MLQHTNQFGEIITTSVNPLVRTKQRVQHMSHSITYTYNGLGRFGGGASCCTQFNYPSICGYMELDKERCIFSICWFVFFCVGILKHTSDGSVKRSRWFSPNKILNFECNTRFGHQIACFICAHNAFDKRGRWITGCFMVLWQRSRDAVNAG